MPEELKLLPCPACGSHATVQNDGYSGEEEVTGSTYVCCSNLSCSMCGPFGHGAEEAARKWNALPRALVLTDDPQFGAWNWWLDGTSCIPCFVYRDGQVSLAMPLERIPYQNLGGQWAGPIPEPSEHK